MILGLAPNAYFNEVLPYIYIYIYINIHPIAIFVCQCSDVMKYINS
jgi:hypothetical protein